MKSFIRSSPGIFAKLWALALLSLCGFLRAPAQAEVITFEDHQTGWPGITAPYHKLNWTNFIVYSKEDVRGSNGYSAPIRSGIQGVYNDYYNGPREAAIAGGLFNLNSAHIGAVWRDGLNFRALGFQSGTLVYSNAYELSAVIGRQIQFNYVGVDLIIFSASGGTLHPGYLYIDDPTFAVDDLDVEVISTLAMRSQPTNCTCVAGDVVSLGVSLSGISPFTYQWLRNGSSIFGATNAFLVFTNVQPSDSGQYSVVVSNIYESVVSSNATLMVTPSPPRFITQPSNRVVGAFSTVELAVGVGGSEPIALQWRFNGVDVEGATNRVLVLPSVQVSGEGSYSLVASNALGFASTVPFFLDVISMDEALNTDVFDWTVAGDLPWFVQRNVTHDGYAAALAGVGDFDQQAVLRTTVAGPGTLTFWWKTGHFRSFSYLAFGIDGEEQERISGSTGWEQKTVYIGSGDHALDWTYVVRSRYAYTDAAGALDEVRFTPGGVPPLVTVNPTNLVIIAGSSATFAASASGTPPLAHQWQFNGTSIEGETNASLTLANTLIDKDGTYALRISNAYGFAVTTAVSLNVVDLPEALNGTSLTWSLGGSTPWRPQTAISHDSIAALESGYVSPGAQSVLLTTVNGPGTLRFWWRVSAQMASDWLSFSVDDVVQERISGSIPWELRTLYLTPGPHKLTWSLSRGVSSVSASLGWLDEVSFAEGPMPGFSISGPADQYAFPSTNVTFSVVAGGTPPLIYQWLFNGREIPSATNAVLILTNVDINHRGSYSVLVTNIHGGGISREARLHLANLSGWGAGASNGTAYPNYRQSIVPALTVTSVAAGAFHNLALQPDGTVATWGLNDYSQSQVPPGLSNVTAISAGLYHSVALRGDGTVVAWGTSQYGASTVPMAATNIAAIAAGLYHTVALRSNGTVVAWGAGSSPKYFPPDWYQSIVPAGLSNVSALAAGAYHNLALKRDGTVIAWGGGMDGQTSVPSGLSNVIAIAAGYLNSLALRADGTVVAWGDNMHGQSTVPDGLSNVVAISAGNAHSLVLRSDGTLVAWGRNTNGQTNVPPGVTNVTAISAGADHNVCIRNVGDVAILKHPVNQIIPELEMIRLEVAALGVPPLSFQWLRDEAGISGATDKALIIDSAQFTQTGAYRVIVSNVFGAVTSSVASVTVVDRFPAFVAQPSSQFVLPTSNGVFTARATGLTPLWYQWRFNNVPLPGQTNQTFVIKNAQQTNEGFYSMAVSNVLGIAVSSNAFLDVIDLGEALDATNLVWTTSGSAPWFPQAASVYHGATAASSAPRTSQAGYVKTTVQGPGTVTFWWRRGDLNVELYFSLDITNEFRLYNSNGTWQEARYYVPAGTHILQWDTSGSGWTYFGGVSLDKVRFTPGPALAFSGVAPASPTNGAGSDVTFTAKAEGTPPLQYQWHFAGKPLTGATSSTLRVTNVQSRHTGLYSVTVTNDFGWTNGSTYLAVTSAPPSMRAQPAHQEMVPGGSVVFAPDARGSEPLSYQWQFNGEDILGATCPTLTVSNIRTNDAGHYRVRVTNAYGTVVSTNATLALAKTVIVGWGEVFTSSPNPPLGLTNVAAIAAGDDFSAALKTDGTVFAWGWDAFGKLNVPTGLSNVIVIVAGWSHGSTLRRDGTVVNWGDASYNEAAVVPPGLSNVVDVAAFYRRNLALMRDGTVTAWGDDFPRPLTPPTNLKNVVDVAAGWNHDLALLSDGSVVAWGDNYQGQTNVPPGLSNVVGIAAGDSFSLALKTDGNVTPWGRGYFDMTNLPPSLKNVVSLAAGTHHAIGLRGDGTVVDWGSYSSGKTDVPSWLTNVVAISAGRGHSLALLNDGSPYITRQPWHQTISVGTDVEFVVRSMGIPPFRYQWQFKGKDIAEATNAVLRIRRVLPDATGDYRCLVSNAIGEAASLPAALTVKAAPYFVPGLSGIDSQGRFTMHLSGLSGSRQIIIYASTDLLHWQPILTNAPVGGDLIITDSSTGWPVRFYRAQER